MTATRRTATGLSCGTTACCSPARTSRPELVAWSDARRAAGPVDLHRVLAAGPGGMVQRVVEDFAADIGLWDARG